MDGCMLLAGAIIVSPGDSVWTLGIRRHLSAGILTSEGMNLGPPAAILMTMWRKMEKKKAKLEELRA